MEKILEKGLFYTFLIEKRDEIESGIFISESDDWFFIKSLYTDYWINGYKLINKKFVSRIKRDEEEIFSEAVLMANKATDLPHYSIPLETNNLFEYLREKQIVIEVSGKDDSIIFLGKVEKHLLKSFRLKMLDPKAKWLNLTKLFMKDSVRYIGFDTNYINSLVNYSNIMK